MRGFWRPCSALRAVIGAQSWPIVLLGAEWDNRLQVWTPRQLANSPARTAQLHLALIHLIPRHN